MSLVRSRVPLVFLAILLSMGIVSADAVQNPRPNVILVVVDALRADYLGVYGFKGGISPVIDQFAKEGVLFNRCASAAPWTKPSVTSLFTSLSPETHGLTYPTMQGDQLVLSEVLPPAAVTMAELFRDNGYRTAAFNSNPWIEPASGLTQGFDVYQYAQYADRMALLNLVNTWISTGVAGKPLFLYVHSVDVHGPYLFNRADFEQMQTRLANQPGAQGAFDITHIDTAAKHMKPTFTNPEMGKSVLNWRAAYAAGVKRFDRRFAGFLEKLRTSGLLDSSIVVFTSDHGENLMQHGFLEHGDTLNIEELHVPLIIRFPDKRLAGQRVDNWVSLVDLLPTLAELCSLKVSAPAWQGHSLVPELNGVKRVGRTVFSAGTKQNKEAASALSGDYHLLSLGGGRVPMLFNMSDDPFEQTDIAAREPTVTSRLLGDLSRHLEIQRKTNYLGYGLSPMTQEMQEQLRSLGYLQ